MITAAEVAQLLGGKLIGQADLEINEIIDIHDNSNGGLAIIHQKKDLNALETSKAEVIIGPSVIESVKDKTLIVIDKIDPMKLNQLLRFYKVKRYGLEDQCNTSDRSDVHIGNHVSIGKDCYFMPGVKIMNGVTIGDNVVVHANTVIKEGTVIGSNVTIDANCSIGNYSFEYLFEHGEYIRLESVGRVIIEDDVEIGANNTIDRGTFGSTVIGRGTKLDNQIQIGHDVKIGQHCLIVSQVGIAGWTILEDHVIVHGQAGLAGGLRIGRGTMIKAQAGVTKSCKPNSQLCGYPARESSQFLSTVAALNKLSRQPQSKLSAATVESESPGVLRRWLRKLI